METIKTYLDNMFAGLPAHTQVMNLKLNILENMEEKYQELKRQGKSENEAIGIVISEFGNIDELVSELGLKKEEGSKSGRLVNRNEVLEYISAKESAGLLVAIGVFLCVLSAAVLILTSTLIDYDILNMPEFVPITMLLLLVAIAVALFIKSGMDLEPYKFMEQDIVLPYELEQEIRQEYNKFKPAYNLSIVLGVCMIILSPITLFITSEQGTLTNTIGLTILLIIIDIAIMFFIIPGNKKDYYDRLLHLGEHEKVSTDKKKEDVVIGAVASIVWPLAVVIFLIMGFAFQLWYICWLVFPVTGIK